MADIFAGTTPPAWLVSATAQQPGQLGDIGGLAVGGLMNALQRDPAAPPNASFVDSRKGLGEGIAEARLNIQDPLWKLKAAQTQALTLGRVAQAETQYARAQAQIADTAAWMEDSKSITPWLTARPEDRKDLPIPAVRSKTGATLLERTQAADSQYFIKREATQQQLEATKLKVENNSTKLKDLQLWDNAYAELTPQQRNIIDALPNGGRDKSTALTPAARSQIDALRVGDGKLPVGTAPSVQSADIRAKTAKEVETQKQEGRSALEDQRQAGRANLEDQRQSGREDLEGLRAKDKLKYEEERQKNRKGLLADASKYKIDLAKIVSELKITSKDGKPVGKTDFVNRHFNSVFNAIVKDTGKAADASKQAISILEGSYDSFTPSVKETAPKAQGQGTAAPAKPSATTTNADPLGLFK